MTKPGRHKNHVLETESNKFYNNNSDTGFIYYNATNTYLAQSFFFNSFTANVGASYTSNSNYSLQILDAGIQPNFPKFGTVGVGIKINNYNIIQLNYA